MVVCGMSTQPALAENYLEVVESSAIIVEAYDGDTVILKFTSGPNRSDIKHEVNLIGVDACGPYEPTRHYRNPCYAREATDFLKSSIEGKTVTVKWDSRDRVGRRGRLLLYVELDGVDINKEVLKNGLGWVPRRHKMDKQSEYIKAEHNAIKNNTGLWGNCPELSEFLKELNKGE